MKKFGPLLLLVLIAGLSWAGCSGSASAEEETTTKIHVIYPEVPLCDKQFVEGDTIVWQNFQIRNAYPVEMIISKIEVRGNSTCAFKVYREPFQSETGMQLCPEESADNALLNLQIPYGASTLFRVEYTPSQEGVMDYATIVLTSNTNEVLTHSVAPIEKNVNIETGEISEEETDVSRIFIPMCGGAILQPPDAGVSDDAEFPDVCPVIDPAALNPALCGDPLPQDTPGCQ